MKSFAYKKGCAYLITDYLTRKYLTGVDIAEGYLVFTDKLTYFTDARYFGAAKPMLESFGICPMLFKDFSALAEFIKENGANKLLIDYSRVTVSEYKLYKSLGFKVGDCSSALEKMRAKKDGSELKNIKRACEIIEKAVETTFASVKVGVTELELKSVLEENIKLLGASGPSFDTIVAFGANSAVPHHVTGNTVLKENSCILIDAGAVYNGYCSDITRTAFFGVPNEKFIERYELVRRANESAIEKIKAGILTCEADGFARQVLEGAGYGEFFTHSLGHGVGLEIHEYPTLSPKRKAKLTNNMVFTIEPGLYFDGEYGIRIEDTVVLKNGRVKRLFNDSKQLKII